MNNISTLGQPYLPIDDSRGYRELVCEIIRLTCKEYLDNEIDREDMVKFMQGAWVEWSELNAGNIIKRLEGMKRRGLRLADDKAKPTKKQRWY